MQVKKFEAPTMAEALNIVKTELGPDAIILSTKNHRKGFGLLSKASVEVTAAVSDRSLQKKKITERLVPEQQKKALSKMSATKQARVYEEFGDYVEKKRQSKEQVAQAQAKTTTRYADIADDDSPAGYSRNGRAATPAASSVPSSNTTIAASSRANVNLSGAGSTSTAASSFRDDTIASLSEDVRRLKQIIDEMKTEQAVVSDTRLPNALSEQVQTEFQNLLRNGIDKKIATTLIKNIEFELSGANANDGDKIVEALAVELMNGVKTSDPLDFKVGSEQRIYAFVGPTGVGKTTTIAKLASMAILQKNLRVGLINVDAYKVAALDQLATYAKILNVPFRQASNTAELDRALTEFKPLDLILIDTSGRSQRDSESLAQMKTLLSENTAIRPLLILCATTRDQELYDTVQRFKIFNPSGLVFSKLDEATTFGTIYNVASKTKLPLTYFTVGQRVPEDIENASRERVADLILDI